MRVLDLDIIYSFALKSYSGYLQSAAINIERTYYYYWYPKVWENCILGIKNFPKTVWLIKVFLPWAISQFLINIHLIPKWRPINYSFLCMFISPLCLIFTSKFFCVFYMLTRHQGLIKADKRIICWPPFWNTVYLLIRFPSIRPTKS